MNSDGLLRRLLAGLPAGFRVRRLERLGVLTAACCRRWGLASTLAGGAPPAEERLAPELPGLPPEGLDAGEAAAWILAPEPWRAAAGAAVVNALLLPPPGPDRSAVDRLADWARGRRLVLVGRFPFRERLAAEAASTEVIELVPVPGETAWRAAGPVLARAEVICATGGMLINHTLEELLALAPAARLALVGPTVPAAPELLAAGVHLLAGVAVEDPERAIPALARGEHHRLVPGLRRWILEAA